MIDKLTLEDLLIKIMPGGILVCVLCFLYAPHVISNANSGFDFVYAFIFLTFSYLAGELIQIIAHLNVIERYMICIFFKFYKPSEIFLYRENPVIKEESLRQDILGHLKLNTHNAEEFKQKYKDLPLFFFKKDSSSQSQSIFWKLYSNLSGDSEIKIFNRGYLFYRGFICLFIILSFLFFIEDYKTYSVISILLFVVFLYRARGTARTLVFKVAILNLRSKK